MIIDERVAGPGQGDGESAASPRRDTPAEVAASARSGAHVAPDLVGLDSLDAHALAGSLDLRLSVSVWKTTVGPWGRVLDQRPASGARLRRGSTVHVVVSGRPHAPIPNVDGLPLDHAIQLLSWLGFVPLVVPRRLPSSSVPAGHVVSTRPVAGTSLAHGAVVALTIAKGEEDRAAGPVRTPSGAR